MQKYQNLTWKKDFINRSIDSFEIQLFVKEDSNGTRAKIDLPRVTSSVYSNSSPTGIPLAIVEVLIW